MSALGCGRVIDAQLLAPLAALLHLHRAAAAERRAEIAEGVTPYFAGVDPVVVSQNGVTALDIAREFKNEAAIAVLAAAAK